MLIILKSFIERNSSLRVNEDKLCISISLSHFLRFNSLWLCVETFKKLDKKYGLYFEIFFFYCIKRMYFNIWYLVIYANHLLVNLLEKKKQDLCFAFIASYITRKFMKKCDWRRHYWKYNWTLGIVGVNINCSLLDLDQSDKVRPPTFNLVLLFMPKPWNSIH